MKTKEIKIGNIKIGGGNPIAIQSMTNTDTADISKTQEQINRLTDAGCDIIRLAVRDMTDIEACKHYIAESKVPLVADIQFDYKLAVASADIGFAKVRYNPGNTSKEGLKELVGACVANSCPIRIGINGGSLEKDLRVAYGGATAEALAESAVRAVHSLEKLNFDNIVISVKSSDVRISKDAYTLLSARTSYPLHIGITESGSGEEAVIKSTAGIAALLLDGIGDTIRVSLTGDPVREVEVGKSILRSIGLDKNYIEVVSCPTCARCFYELESLVNKCKAMVKGCKKSCKIAVMGCVVNGPGEAADADIGIAGGKEKSVLFVKGKIVETLPTSEAEDKFLAMVKELID